MKNAFKTAGKILVWALTAGITATGSTLASIYAYQLLANNVRHPNPDVNEEEGHEDGEN